VFGEKSCKSKKSFAIFGYRSQVLAGVNGLGLSGQSGEFHKWNSAFRRMQM